MLKFCCIIYIFFINTLAQWSLLRPESPPNLTTGPNAQINKTTLSPTWCFDGSMYVLNDHMWKYEIESDRWLWQPEVPIPKRYGAAYWTIRDTFYVYGGMTDNGTVLSDMWTYNPKTRESLLIHPGSEETAYGTSFWTHEQSNRLYLWGGGHGLRAFDVSTNQWIQITHSGTPDNGFFGSATNGGYLYINDRLWQLDMSTYTWNQLPTGVVVPPGPNRIYHTIWTIGGTLYLYGGVSGSKVYSDTWKYTNGQWIDMSTVYAGKSPKDISQFSTCGSLYLFLGAVWTFGNANDLTILQKVENGLQSAVLWAFAATILSGLVFIGLFSLAFILCVKRCMKKKNSIPMQPLNDNFQLYFYTFVVPQHPPFNSFSPPPSPNTMTGLFFIVFSIVFKFKRAVATTTNELSIDSPVFAEA